MDVVEGKIVALDKNGQEVVGKIRFTMPGTSETSIYKLEISNNIFDLTALTPDFLLIAEKNGLLNLTKSCCIAHCDEQYTDPNTGEKEKGRSRCKAQCYQQGELPHSKRVV